MNTAEIAESLTSLLTELLDGAQPGASYMLNPGDRGLLLSLESLDATTASHVGATGSSIVSHVRHLQYGFSLMNRWLAGENPWADADWKAAWRNPSASDTEWRQLLAEFRAEAGRWRDALGEPRDVGRVELNGIVGSVAHLAYHLGAIRQMAPATRGPSHDA
jgi:hypothetical protein